MTGVQMEELDEGAKNGFVCMLVRKKMKTV